MDRDRPSKRARSCEEHPILKLNIGGKRFDVARSTFVNASESIFPRMFGGSLPPANLDDNGRFYIDRNPDMFRYIIQWLREGACDLPESATDLRKLSREANFYCLTSLEEMVVEKHAEMMVPRYELSVWGVRTYCDAKVCRCGEDEVSNINHEEDDPWGKYLAHGPKPLQQPIFADAPDLVLELKYRYGQKESLNDEAQRVVGAVTPDAFGIEHTVFSVFRGWPHIDSVQRFLQDVTPSVKEKRRVIKAFWYHGPVPETDWDHDDLSDTSDPVPDHAAMWLKFSICKKGAVQAQAG